MQNEATLSQLRRLAELAQVSCPSEWDRWFTMGTDAYTAAERLFFTLNPDQEGDREAAAEFWGGHLADREVQEFAEGALEYLLP